MPRNIKPLVCPRCGNTSDREGISYLSLEWCAVPVTGQTANEVVVDWDESEQVEAGIGEVLTCTNVPNNERDLSHYHCIACRFNWSDSRNLMDSGDLDGDLPDSDTLVITNPALVAKARAAVADGSEIVWIDADDEVILENGLTDQLGRGSLVLVKYRQYLYFPEAGLQRADRPDSVAALSSKVIG